MAELLSVPIDSGSLSVRLAAQALQVRISGVDGAVLHWGFLKYAGGAWGCPPPECRPAGTEVHDAHAARTPLPDGQDVLIPLPPAGAWYALAFVVHQSHRNRWHKCGNGDFNVVLPVTALHAPAVPGAPVRRSPADVLSAAYGIANDAIQIEDLGVGQPLAWAMSRNGNEARVCFATTVDGPLYLHWALSNRGAGEWNRPVLEQCPPGTLNFDDKAVRTPFDESEGLRTLALSLRGNVEAQEPAGLNCVFFQSETNHWLKAGGRDLFIPLFRKVAPSPITDGRVRGIADTIIRAEVEYLSWTLMHRYNLCCDLLNGVDENPQALALIFVWLRYSALRQLDWQRRYNTKPRDLSHAQDRLTLRLAALWRQQAHSRLWVRRMLGTLGRGGDGQKIRDEILQIMHRNHIGEKSGTFLEEWHQKLHNNTTPDDVPICEAYLVFLRSNGKLDEFYKALEAGGVTRQRLAGFERAIKTDPVLFQDKKDALIGEFENFLRILKAVHLGTDLETAIGAAKPHLDGGLVESLRKLLKSKAVERDMESMAILAGRNAIAERLKRGGDDAMVRDLLYLDLALEARLRSNLEALPLSQLPLEKLSVLALQSVENVQHSEAHSEFERCSAHFSRVLDALPDGIPADRDWALHARSVTERMHRCVQQRADETYQALQPLAEYLGAAFNAEGWTIELFSEEVVRSGPTFPLSLVLQRIDPQLREAAGIGGWQIVSPHAAQGRVQCVDALVDVQEQVYAEPTVLVTPHVSGNEEIPAGVTAVLTTDAPDLVSHVAVRARNAGVLFATCFEKPVFESLKQLAAQQVSLQVTPAGDVVVGTGTEPLNTAPAAPSPVAAPMQPPSVQLPAGAPWILLPQQFTRELVGGKSNNLNGLRGRVAEWIQFPASMTLPFGTLERVLEAPLNREIRNEIVARVNAAALEPLAELPKVREAILHLNATLELKDALREAWSSAGLPALDWPDAWRGITRVWASKWTDRAYFSRRARGVPHESLLMAVLVQQVVEADYAFVIHTANPINGNRDEIYTEVVCGLGETLVGNYPGRALGFVFNKKDRSIRLTSFPSKSEGLYGRGVIFRSDSNGEDLQGFAGAGLYDSVLAHEAETRPLDYTQEPLVWDVAQRTSVLNAIAEIGMAVEGTLGSAQDIEGAVSRGRYFVVQTRPQVGLA